MEGLTKKLMLGAYGDGEVLEVEVEVHGRRCKCTATTMSFVPGEPQWSSSNFVGAWCTKQHEELWTWKKKTTMTRGRNCAHI